MPFTTHIVDSVYIIWTCLTHLWTFEHIDFPCLQTHRIASYNEVMYTLFSGSGSSVVIATELRAGRSGIESRWRRDFPPVHTGPGAHPASCKMCTGSFPGVKCGRSVLVTTHPLLVPRSWKSRAIPLPTLWATPGLKRDHLCKDFIKMLTQAEVSFCRRRV